MREYSEQKDLSEKKISPLSSFFSYFEFLSRAISFLKKQNNSGQGIVEYTTVVVLVAAGIIISSPYVKRSWNTYVKNWEDDIIESYNDPLEIADPAGIDVEDCYCPAEFSPHCGIPENPLCCGLSICTAQQSFVQIVCNHYGCPGTDTACEDNDECCTAFRNTSLCGAHGNAGILECPPGMLLQVKDCGAGTTRTRCIGGNPDNLLDLSVPHANCITACTFVNHAGGALPDASLDYKYDHCFGDEDGLLDNDVAFHFIDVACSPGGEGSPNDDKCEIRCKEPFTWDTGVDPNETGCICPLQAGSASERYSDRLDTCACGNDADSNQMVEKDVCGEYQCTRETPDGYASCPENYCSITSPDFPFPPALR